MSIYEAYDMYGKVTPWLRVTRLPLLALGILMPVALLSFMGQLFTLYGLGVVLVISFANTGMNMLNEVMDVEEDKKNKPWRPLPSGELSVKVVGLVSAMMINISLLFSVFLFVYGGFYIALLAIVMVITAFIYNYSRRDVIGVGCMSFTYAAAGALCLYPNLNYMLYWGVGFFLYTYSHNIVEQLQDIDDDMELTIPKQVGGGNSLGLASVASFFSILSFLFLGDVIIIFFILPSVAVLMTAMYLPYPEKGWKDMVEVLLRTITRIVLITVTIIVLIWSLMGL